MAFASFDGKRGATPMSDINMVPLIDVMLVLLVIFIVTAPLLTHAVKLDLPKVTTEVNPVQPEKIEFAIDAEGRRYLDGEAVTREQAAQRFTRAAEKPVKPELHLRADRRAAYGAVAETIGDASRAGISKIGFVSQPDQPE